MPRLFCHSSNIKGIIIRGATSYGPHSGGATVRSDSKESLGSSEVFSNTESVAAEASLAPVQSDQQPAGSLRRSDRDRRTPQPDRDRFCWREPEVPGRRTADRSNATTDFRTWPDLYSWEIAISETVGSNS